MQDFLFQSQARLQQVTASSVFDAARRHLHPQAQDIVVVGDAAKFRSQLTRLGMPIQDLAL